MPGKSRNKTAPRKPARLKPLRPVSSKQSKTRKLMYTRRAKQFIRRNPGFMREFIAARKELLAMPSRRRVKKGSLVVDRYSGTKGTKWRSAPFYYVARKNGKAFFIKEESSPSTWWPYQPSSQMKAMKRAEKVLRGHGIQPIQYEFGLETTTGSFVVAEYHDLQTVWDMPSGKLRDSLKARIEEADTDLIHETGVYDLKPKNCFYDPENKRLIAFDLLEA